MADLCVLRDSGNCKLATRINISLAAIAESGERNGRMCVNEQNEDRMPVPSTPAASVRAPREGAVGSSPELRLGGGAPPRRRPIALAPQRRVQRSASPIFFCRRTIGVQAKQGWRGAQPIGKRDARPPALKPLPQRSSLRKGRSTLRVQPGFRAGGCVYLPPFWSTAVLRKARRLVRKW